MKWLRFAVVFVLFVEQTTAADDWATKWLGIPNSKNFDDKAAAIRSQIPIESLQIDPTAPQLHRAAIYDLTGDFEKAEELYRRGIGRTMTPPIAARLHLIRILRNHFPEKLTGGIWDLKHFEEHIAWIELLPNRPNAGAVGASYRGDPWRELANMVSSLSKSTMGEFTVPPLWKPDMSMVGKFPNRFQVATKEIIRLRRDAAEVWFRGAFENPAVTSWAFSRIAALADLDGKFENNAELVKLAEAALAKMAEPTPFGAIPVVERPYPCRGDMQIRMYPPELYLAWHINKGDLQAGVLTENPGVKTRLNLLTCNATEFFSTVDSLIGKEFDHTFEAVQLWELRNQNVDLLEHLLVLSEFPNMDLLQKVRMPDGMFLFGGIYPRRPISTWLRVFDLVAEADGSDKRVQDALKRLAVCCLGPLEEQKKELRDSVPPPGVIICGTDTGPEYYLRLLNGMMRYPNLADTGYRKAQELRISDQIYRQQISSPNERSKAVTKLETQILKIGNRKKPNSSSERIAIQNYINLVKSSKTLKIDPKKFVPKSFDGRGVDGERRQLREGLQLAAETIGDQLPPEYLFLAAQGRWGWVSSQGRKAVSDIDFLNSVANEFEGEKREIVKAGLILGSNRYEWIYRRNLNEPGWKNHEVANAFETIGRRIANRALPGNLRMAIAEQICRDCGRHISPQLSIQFIEMMIEAWNSGTTVYSETEKQIISGFFHACEIGDDDKQVAKRLLNSWKRKIAGSDIQSENSVIMLGIAARLQDKEMIKWLTGPRWVSSWHRESVKPLIYLIREGHIDEAVLIHRPLLQLARDRYYKGRTSIPRDVLYDGGLHKNLPLFLKAIETSKAEDVFVKVLLNYTFTDPFDPGLNDLATRLKVSAQEIAKTDFTNAEKEKIICLKLIANDWGASAILVDQYLKVLGLDEFDAHFDSDNYYPWKWSLQATIKSLLAAERFDDALALLRQVDEITEIKTGNYTTVWGEFTYAVSSCVTFYQDEPEKLRQLLPITRFMAQLPDAFFAKNQKRNRAGNYARNIFCHGLLDRMDEWKKWRLELPEPIRNELDENWYPQSGWMIGLPSSRIKHDRPVQFRVELMKRFLMHPEVIGNNGTLYNSAIDQIVNRGYLTRAELLGHGKPLVDVIADGGNAVAAFDVLKSVPD